MRNDKPKTVYAIHCKETKRTYIGCCTDFHARVRQHFSELKAGHKQMRITRQNRGNTPWQNDYNEYGRGAFEVYVLEENVPAERASELERQYILRYRSNESEFGYNINPVWREAIEVVPGAPPLPSKAS